MKLYLQGDRGKALCEHCQQVVGITYTRRDVPFSDGNGQAREILVGVCDQCATTVAIPPVDPGDQGSAPPATDLHRGAAACGLPRRAGRRDALGGRGRRGADAQAVLQLLLQRPLVPALEQVHDGFAQYLAQQAEVRQIPAVNAMKRLSLKVNHYVAEDLARLLQATRMTQTELLKSLIAQIRLDVLEGGNPAVIADLRQLVRLGL